MVRRSFFKGSRVTKTPPTLAQVREKIDTIDNDLLRLIDKRAALTREVADAKRAAGDLGTFALRPARETQILRRLAGAEKSAASKALVVRVWRELIGDSLHGQTPFSIITWSHQQPARIAERARARFGGAPTMYDVDQPEAVIAQVRDGGAVGVLAISRDHAWWARMLVEPTLSIVGALPEVDQWGSPTALVIAQVAPEPSGAGDETLWVTDSTMQGYEIETAMSIDGIAGRMIAEANRLKLFALAGYYQADDERLARAPGDLTGVVGVAPVPFDVT